MPSYPPPGPYDTGPNLPVDHRPRQRPRAAPVSNYLVWGILAMIFCCAPFGAVSIAYATQVNSLAMSGNTDAALVAAAKAKRWAQIAAIVGGSIILLYVLLYVAGFVLISQLPHRNGS